MSEGPILLPIERIRLTGDVGAKFLFPDDPESETALVGLGRLNLFVGPNNSGKSRSLRVLAANTGRTLMFRADPNSPLFAFRERVRALEQNLRKLGVKGFSGPQHYPLPSLESLLDPFSFDHFKSKTAAFLEMVGAPFPNPPPEGVSLPDHWDTHPLSQEARTLAGEWKVLEARLALPKSTPQSSVYIPALRGARRLGDSVGLDDKARQWLLNEDIYIHQTLLEQFRNPNGAHPIGKEQLFTGYLLYEEIRKRLLGDLQDRQLIRAYEEMLGSQFFDGQTVALIPKHDSTWLHIKIGREKEQPLGMLGDGVQQLVILTFLPFVRGEPHLFFVEEPELFLHPGIARRICEYYLERASVAGHTFFLATHSNHLLDLGWDHEGVQIYQVTKEDLTPTQTAEAEADAPGEPVNEIEPLVRVELASPSQRTLAHLGVRASSVLFANAVIWVEGPTDHAYLGPLVKTALTEQRRGAGRILAENLHYVFAYYAGALIQNWSFGEEDSDQPSVERLCARSMVIADKDSGEKHWRDDRLREQLGDRFRVIDGREIENLLPPQVIWDVVRNYEKAKGEAPLPSIVPFDQASYLKEFLAPFLEEEIAKAKGGQPSARKGGYRAEPKTKDSKVLKAKGAFAEKALQTLSYPDGGMMSKLADEIADFVVKSNRPGCH